MLDDGDMRVKTQQCCNFFCLNRGVSDIGDPRRIDRAHLKDALLVLCGDHGMTNAGNHGGSAPGETSPAMLFMSPKLKQLSKGRDSPIDPYQDYEYYNVIEQSDVAPTLAGLLGFPVPLNNLGVFVPDVLPLWDNGMSYKAFLFFKSLTHT